MIIFLGQLQRTGSGVWQLVTRVKVYKLGRHCITPYNFVTTTAYRRFLGSGHALNWPWHIRLRMWKSLKKSDKSIIVNPQNRTGNWSQLVFPSDIFSWVTGICFSSVWKTQGFKICLAATVWRVLPELLFIGFSQEDKLDWQVLSDRYRQLKPHSGKPSKFLWDGGSRLTVATREIYWGKSQSCQI